MPFRDFTFPAVTARLGLSSRRGNLFAGVGPASIAPDFGERIGEGAKLAVAINTEKARSEFVVAPVLQELHRRHSGAFALFSGVPLDVDPVRGLNGVCDFLLARSPYPFAPEAPLLALVEAKNDNPWNGMGQCVATMVAVWEFNQAADERVPAVFGAATSGTLWHFAELVGTDPTIDAEEYHISDLAKVMGILESIVRRPAVG